MDSSFILETSIDTAMCDELVRIFENNLSDTQYDAGRQYWRLLSQSLPEHIRYALCDMINVCLMEYYETWPWCQRESPPIGLTPFNIQKYEPNKAYRGWHIEDGGPEPGRPQRKLVWMTYLNDVYNGGETQFKYQSKAFFPRKGTTLIWPAIWTHPHRGIPATSEIKYIATGWFRYMRDDEDEVTSL